eukprot:352312-Chlamydomonas_euryale.AAC.11
MQELIRQGGSAAAPVNVTTLASLDLCSPAAAQQLLTTFSPLQAGDAGAAGAQVANSSTSTAAAAGSAAFAQLLSNVSIMLGRYSWLANRQPAAG